MLYKSNPCMVYLFIFFDRDVTPWAVVQVDLKSREVRAARWLRYPLLKSSARLGIARSLACSATIQQ